MGRKGENIFKRKDGRYEGRYIKEYLNGKPLYGYVYAKSYNECKRKRNCCLLNNTPNTKKINSKKILNDLVFDWLKSKENIKKSTYTQYYNLIIYHIKDDIGKYEINKINSLLVKKYVNTLLNNGKKNTDGGLSKNTVYDVLNILKQVFKENKIDIEIPKIKKNIGCGKSFFDDDKRKIEKYLENDNSNISLGIMLSLYLGLRRSEVCGIKWEDIDINNKVLYINHIISRVKSFDTKKKTKLIISTPKTENSKRILPIPNKVLNKLLKIKEIDNNNYLLTNNKNFMDPRTFYNHYKSILKKLNINYTYHDLRHTFATNCIEMGIDCKSLMELLGHSNITTTLNIYVHSTINKKREFLNKL